jgi:hypothetical protein
MTADKLRQQAATEFMLTYGWALLILAIIVIAFVYFYGLPGTVIQNTCTFVSQITCDGITLGSNSIGTKIDLIAINSQPFGLSDPIATVYIAQYGSANAMCLPSNVVSGGAMLCSIGLARQIPQGASVSGMLYINAQACISGTVLDCSVFHPTNYSGSFIQSVGAYTSNIPIAISLTESQSSISQTGRVMLVAHVAVFGYPSRGNYVQFSSSSPIGIFSQQDVLSDSSGDATTYFNGKSPGSTTIIAEFAGYTASNTISIT